MSFVKELTAAFYALERPDNACWMRGYMRDQYPFIGIKKPERSIVFKAIGWMLRQYGRTDADWVREFVEENELMPLSKREALKHISHLPLANLGGLPKVRGYEDF